MGVVVAAHHLELDQPVAIKFLLEGMADKEEGAERFRREARAAAKIHSDHVVRVLDVGVMADGTRYMVMEYLEGRDLSEELAEKGSFPVGVACGFLLEAMDAVGHAHAVGIVHRDLKPANLFLAKRHDGSQRIKVLDFGISKSLGASTSEQLSLTKTSAWIGSPLYMAPEQMQSARDVDSRADIWSLGAILYECISGVPPYEAESLPQLCNLLITTDAPHIQSRKADVPDDLAAAIMGCLVRDKSKRLPQVADLAKVVVRYATTITGTGMSRIMLERSETVSSSSLSSIPYRSSGVPQVRSTAPSLAAQPVDTQRSIPPSELAPSVLPRVSAQPFASKGAAAVSGVSETTLSSVTPPGSSPNPQTAVPLAAPGGPLGDSNGSSSVHAAWGATDRGGKSKRGVSPAVWGGAALAVSIGLAWVLVRGPGVPASEDVASLERMAADAEGPKPLVPEPHEPASAAAVPTAAAVPPAAPVAASVTDAAAATPSAGATSPSAALAGSEPSAAGPDAAKAKRTGAKVSRLPRHVAVPAPATEVAPKPTSKPSDEFSEFGGRR